MSIWYIRASSTSRAKNCNNSNAMNVLWRMKYSYLFNYGLSSLFLPRIWSRVHRQGMQFYIKAFGLHNDIKQAKINDVHCRYSKSTYGNSYFTRSSDFFIKYLSRTNILENCQFLSLFLHVNITGERSFRNID